MKLIVTTNFAKSVSLEECCEFLSEWGMDRIELTTDGRAHAYPYLTPEGSTQVMTPVYKRKIHVDWLSGGWADFSRGDVSLVGKQIHLAKQTGAKGVRFFASNPHEPCESNDEVRDKILRNMKLFAGESIHLENHGGFFKDLDQVERLCWDLPNGQGLVFDPANFIADGVDPIDAIHKLWSFIKHVHVKDITADGNFTAVGEGITPWKSILAFLESYGYDGFYSLEYESDEDYEDKKKGLVRSFDNFYALKG